MKTIINKKDLVQTFIKMVSISSESGMEEEFGEYIIALAKKMGGETKKDKFGNIYLTFKGNGDGLMLNTHMDTVSPGVGIKAKVSGKFVVSDGTTILGADSKAGIAAMMEAVNHLQKNKIPHKDIHITLTRNEESGIPTADKLESKIKICVVPDRGTPIGEIITEAPFAKVFEVEVSGKSVYAPTNYTDGIHAIMAAVNMINSLSWGNIDKDTTTTIGVIKGGTMTSMIPESCTFKGSCYSFKKSSFDKFLKKLQEVVIKTDKKFGTKSKVSMLEYFGGYKLDPKDELVKLTENAIKNTGVKPVYKVYKAVTNANHLNQIGIKTVLISTGVENQHTVKERIAVDTLEKLTQIMVNLVTA